MRHICKTVLIAIIVIIALDNYAFCDELWEMFKHDASGVRRDMSVSVEAKCDDFNYVGNEWSIIFYIDEDVVAWFSNNRITMKASKVYLETGQVFTVSAEITEEDEYSDQGFGEEAFTVTQESLDHGFQVILDVGVTEDKGRFRGNTAIWNIQFLFE